MAKQRNKFIGGAKRPSRPDNEDLGFGEDKPKAEPIKERLESRTPSSKVGKSFTIKGVDPNILEAIKNIVYTEKINGDLFCTQSSIISKALNEYVENYDKEIVERPQELKDREERMATRKRR